MSIVLCLNGGSSSIRFAFYGAEADAAKLLDGKIDRIGSGAATLTVDDRRTGTPSRSTQDVPRDRRSAAAFLIEWLGSHPLFSAVTAVGHRVVHGMQHAKPERITPQLLSELKRITPYDPEHLPGEIELIESMSRRHPDLPQVACFDTAFHRTMPRVATWVPIPRRYLAKGVQRYGFHGLSYTYLIDELRRLGDPAATHGRVVLAHLGNGASLAAVRDGRSIDTTMGFTPASGLVMSTRSGDLDPGVMSFLASTESLDAQAWQTLCTHESGLLGISETSSDIRDLLASAAADPRAAEAVDLFCYQIKKGIGAFAAALGGVDTLVFAGGIGENSPAVRERVCADLGFLGIELHPANNARGAGVISTESAAATVRVIPTDEESVIANSTRRVLQ